MIGESVSPLQNTHESDVRSFMCADCARRETAEGFWIAQASGIDCLGLVGINRHLLYLPSRSPAHAERSSALRFRFASAITSHRGTRFCLHFSCAGSTMMAIC